MHHKQQMPARIVTNNGIAWLIVAACIQQTKQRVEKYRCSLLEAHTIVLFPIIRCLGGIPYEGQTVEFVVNIHD